jgi:hypothetical protein
MYTHTKATRSNDPMAILVRYELDQRYRAAAHGTFVAQARVQRPAGRGRRALLRRCIGSGLHAWSRIRSAQREGNAERGARGQSPAAAAGQ